MVGPGAETGSESENVLRADVDAAPAVGAVGRQDDRPAAVGFALQRRRDDLRLRADGVAVQAVVATGAAGGTDPQQADGTDHAVEGADRAEVPAPGALADEQVEQEHRHDHRPGGADAEDQGAEHDGHRVDQLPGQGAGEYGGAEDGGENPVARRSGRNGRRRLMPSFWRSQWAASVTMLIGQTQEQ